VHCDGVSTSGGKAVAACSSLPGKNKLCMVEKRKDSSPRSLSPYAGEEETKLISLWFLMFVCVCVCFAWSLLCFVFLPLVEGHIYNTREWYRS
jgi:hypothetical protein